MQTNNERSSYSSSNATAGFNAPTMPEATRVENSRGQRYDPAADCGGASYPIPAFFEYRLQPGNRDLL
ncbi:hypothetical protein [Flaviaesturariibacter terrae]